MPIASTDIQFRLSGGAANSNPNASLGGAISSSAVPSGASVGVFDDTNSTEKTIGDVEYRCIYVRNNDATRTLYAAKLWVLANTPSSTTTIDVGLGSSGVNGTEPTTADENTAPSGISYVAAPDEPTAINLGDLAPGAHRAVQLRRTVSASTLDGTDGYTLRVKGDSNP